MRFTDSARPTRVARTGIIVLHAASCALVAAVLAASAVGAEDPAVAREAWNAGNVERARALLAGFLQGDSQDPAQLLAAARLASDMRDPDLVEHTQGRVEVAGRVHGDARLDLALGISYLALGEIRLRSGIPGPTIAFLFADAETLARTLVEEQAGTDLERDGRMLLARTRRAVGDVQGALDALGPNETVADGTWASGARLLGELLYERAVTKGLDADGRPTAAGTADLRETLKLLAGADDAPGRLSAAWAAHRLGALEAAADLYVEAWALDPASPLPLKGLRSLFAARPEGLVAALVGVAAERGRDIQVLDALARAHLSNKDATAALLTLQRRIGLDEADAYGWLLGGEMFFAMRQWREARKHLVEALRRSPDLLPASRLLERVAQSVAATEPERAIAIYDELAGMRPTDAMVLNNRGFLLRELVSPHTTIDENAVQTLHEDAPPHVRAWLERSVASYAAAAALVPVDIESSDLSEQEVWILAGIVNDYGLMLHYFAEVQDLEQAERLYLRTLEMTDGAYMDAYHPNLRRLYARMLPGRELAWYRAAERARWAQQVEARTAGGRFQLVPDEERRALAEQDALRLRALLYAELADGARDDGDPWPPETER